jgi:hypothetical protein
VRLPEIAGEAGPTPLTGKPVKRHAFSSRFLLAAFSRARHFTPSESTETREFASPSGVCRSEFQCRGAMGIAERCRGAMGIAMPVGAQRSVVLEGRNGNCRGL